MVPLKYFQLIASPAGSAQEIHQVGSYSKAYYFVVSPVFHLEELCICRYDLKRFNHLSPTAWIARMAHKRPTISDVARVADVSIGTVSNAINSPEKVRPETLARIEAAIARLNYRPSAVARFLPGGGHRTPFGRPPAPAAPDFRRLYQRRLRLPGRRTAPPRRPRSPPSISKKRWAAPPPMSRWRRPASGPTSRSMSSWRRRSARTPTATGRWPNWRSAASMP